MDLSDLERMKKMANGGRKCCKLETWLQNNDINFDSSSVWATVQVNLCNGMLLSVQMNSYDAGGAYCETALRLGKNDDLVYINSIGYEDVRRFVSHQETIDEVSRLIKFWNSDEGKKLYQKIKSDRETDPNKTHF